MQVELIYSRIEHHAGRSGYDQLARFVAGRAWPDRGFWSALARLLPDRLLRRIPAYYSPWYGPGPLRRELALCGELLRPGRRLYHFFYGENDLRISPRHWLRCGNRIAATFHQPPEFLADHLESFSFLAHLDGLIIMSRSQAPFFRRHLESRRIFHVPHGVDEGFWCPDPAVQPFDRPTFVVVGQWLRDLDLVCRTIRAAGDRGLEMDFKVVTFPDRTGRFEGLPRTEVLTRISDEELKELYRRSWALFLPLTMGTANNAVLEAMSCGRAVISTTVGGVPEYVDGNCSRLIAPGDQEGALGALEELAGDRELTGRLGAAARRRVEERYRWELIGQRQVEAYRRIMALPPGCSI